MKAAVCREFGEPLIVESVHLATPCAGEVQVKIAACAICHSDLSYINGLWGGSLPAVYGHEAAGIVVDVGDGVTNVTQGDHVIVTLIRACGHCHYCMRGEPVLCETSFPLDEKSPLTSADGKPLAQGLRTGAFAEHVVVHSSQVIAIPTDVPLDSACLVACGVITGLGAVFNTAQMPPGASVVVVGTGGVGLNTVQGARIAGARSVIAVDRSERKLEAARQFGATHVINADKANPVDVIRTLMAGRGADYVFVTVGAKVAFDQAFNLIGRGGTVVLVGIAADGVKSEFDPGTLTGWNQRVLGSKMGSARLSVDIPMLIDLYRQGRLKLDELVSERYPFDRINDAIAAVTKGDVLRNVVLF